MVVDGLICQLWLVVPRQTTVGRKETKERREKVGGGCGFCCSELASVSESSQS